MRYAAYGSNLHPHRLRERAPSARLLGTVRLHGWRLRFHKRGQDGSAKCNIIAGPGAIYAAIFEVEIHHKQQLDELEGLHVGYEETHVFAGRFGTCATYLATESHIDDQLLPFSWYRELVLAACEVHGFPKDYVDGIRAIPHQVDDDLSRHEQHMQMVRAIRGGRSAS